MLPKSPIRNLEDLGKYLSPRHHLTCQAHPEGPIHVHVQPLPQDQFVIQVLIDHWHEEIGSVRLPDGALAGLVVRGYGMGRPTTQPEEGTVPNFGAHGFVVIGSIADGWKVDYANGLPLEPGETLTLHQVVECLALVASRLLN